MLFVEVDPILLSRGRGKRRRSGSSGLEPYVNDHPYVASSLLSVALGRLFGSALAGTCDARPELVGRALDLEIKLPVVPVRGGEDVLRRLLEPLDYEVTCAPIPLDEHHPQWGDSDYLSVGLRGAPHGAPGPGTPLCPVAGAG